jgi:putative ribosome biogenesis GTPase RsgA
VTRVLRELFPHVVVRKMIIGFRSPGSRLKQGVFEIVIGDQVVYSKQKESNGVYLHIKDLQDAIDRASQARWVAFADLPWLDRVVAVTCD